MENKDIQATVALLKFVSAHEADFKLLTSLADEYDKVIESKVKTAFEMHSRPSGMPQAYADLKTLEEKGYIDLGCSKSPFPNGGYSIDRPTTLTDKGRAFLKEHESTVEEN